MAHNNLGLALETNKNWREAIAVFEEAIRLSKDNWPAHLNLVRVLTVCPETKHRDPRRAVASAKKAVELNPQSIQAWQTLGWAHYRAGDCQASIQALEKSSELQKGSDSGQSIVLALAHWKLSMQPDLPEPEQVRHRTQARRLYEQSAKQIDGWGSYPQDRVRQAIWAFRAEAAELMGVKKEKK